MFERRYEVFSLVWAFLSDVIRMDSEAHFLTDFSNHIPKVQFLFGKELAAYCREADRYRTELLTLYKVTNDHSQERIIRITELSTWFVHEAQGCYKRFAPFLDFSEWQAGDWTEARELFRPEGV